MVKTQFSEQRFITLEDITIRLFDHFILSHTNWNIQQGEHWAVVGPNGSGKSSLVRALAGAVPVVRGNLINHTQIPLDQLVGYVAFEAHRDFIRQEEERDEYRCFSGDFSDCTTAGQLISGGNDTVSRDHAHVAEIIGDLAIGDEVLDRHIRVLSTGEMRKVLIARALVKCPRLLILDEPFDGLDGRARSRLARAIEAVMGNGTQVILVTHRFEEILPGISNVLCTKDCRVIAAGPRREILHDARIGSLFEEKAPTVFEQLPPVPAGRSPAQGAQPEIVIEINDAAVSYGDTDVIKNLSWTVRRGEHWAIMGPNGSGKSTLLKLISGENLQAYAHEIYLFGIRKGSGESLWDLRKKMSVVSCDFQMYYNPTLRAADVVLSGFFDSVGLYRECTPSQQKAAIQWLEMMGLADHADKRFGHFSYGEQRMILVARAMIKSPLLLILDEPCEGLDVSNRKLIMDLVDCIAAASATQVLYVTHQEDEIPACITNVLALETTKGAHSHARSIIP
jgi:molybdate transport system ATP-binding protein